MTTSMPISVLENILREVNKDTELERLAKEESEKNKEKVEKLKEILDSERSTEKEKSISTEQGLEKSKTQNSRKTTRNGHNNKQKVVEGGESSS